MVEFAVPDVEFSRYSNRQLVAVPLAVLAAALLVIAGWQFLYGTPVSQGIAFTGGTELTLQPGDDVTAQDIRSTFDAEISSIQRVEVTGAYVVRFESTDSSAIGDTAESEWGEEAIEGLQGVSPSFGADAKRTALFGVVAAFVGMSLVVAALFRTFIPSVAVVASAFSDIVIPVALMNLFGIKLTLGTVAALLMLIGYSVDSDILLNNHVLRRSGDFYESVHRAMRTGVTMTVTSLSAMTVMTIVAALTGIDLLASIGLVLVFGLSADLMNTYMLNVTLLRWYKFEGVAR